MIILTMNASESGRLRESLMRGLGVSLGQDRKFGDVSGWVDIGLTASSGIMVSRSYFYTQ